MGMRDLSPHTAPSLTAAQLQLQLQQCPAFWASQPPADRLKHAGEKLDPRAAIAGRYAGPEAGTNGADHWQSGLFDRGTWREAHQDWAQSVVTGRARLGGIAVGEPLPLELPRPDRRCV